jgi:uncharacterized glyoxalase superfamily protein PhnB
MNAHTNVAGRTLVPTLRYRDVPAAIAWLCRTFGFEQHLVVTGDDGSVRYAQLTFGEGMVMVVPVEDTAFDQLMKQPEEAGGAETQICYLYVEDVGAHYTRAKAGGAEILLDIEDADVSARGYSCRDLEGHIWNFGTYDPWRGQEAPEAEFGSLPRPYRRVKHLGVVVGLFLLTIALGAVIGWSYGPVYEALTENAAASDSSEVDAIIQRERRGRETAERAAAAARDQLARERGAREMAERASKEIEARVARASTEQIGAPTRATEAAERAREEAREHMQQAQREAAAARGLLALEQKAREAAEETAREARERAARERVAREAAERTTRAMREHAARERARRLRARQAMQGTNGPSWIYAW